jgi:hypothetical protein
MKSPLRFLACLSACAAFVATLPAAVEAVKNLLAPTAQLTAWQFEEIDDAKGTMKAEAGALALTASKIDGTEWHVQAYQAGLELANGTEYTVTFKARASAKRTAQVYAGVNEDDYHAVGLDEVITLAPEWKDFKFTFKADGVAARHNNRLGFLVGQETGTVWIKDLVLVAK